MTIELLYFDGCPSYEALLPRMQALLREYGIDEKSVRLRQVETPAAAQSERFLGSPTLRIDGRDVEPGADQRTDFGLKCRIFRGAGAVPPDEWIIGALAGARNAAAGSRSGANHA